MAFNSPVVEALAEQAAQDVLEYKTKAICVVLTKLLGEKQFSIQDLKDFGRFEDGPEPHGQTFYFDNRAIIHFGEPKVSIAKQAGFPVGYSIDVPYEVLCTEVSDANRSDTH